MYNRKSKETSYKLSFYSIVILIIITALLSIPSKCLAQQINSQSSDIGYLFVNENFIPLDKQMHGAGGMVIGVLGYSVSRGAFKQKRWVSILTGTLMATGVGHLKETSDNKAGGTGYDNIDLLYTSVGGLVSSIGLDLLVGSNERIEFRKLSKSKRKQIKLKWKEARKNKTFNRKNKWQFLN